MTKTLDRIRDLKIVGDGDAWKLLCKASSGEQEWMKSTKAMEIEGAGCLVQVTTQQGAQIAEAVTFVPGVFIAPSENGGAKLVALVLPPRVNVQVTGDGKPMQCEGPRTPSDPVPSSPAPSC